VAVKRKISVVIEKTNTGFSAFAEALPVYTTGTCMSGLIRNTIEAVSLCFENETIDSSDISFVIDFKQFFKYYKVLNSKALAEKIGMNPTLLSQYIRGHKKPSPKQSQRILYGINQVGQELAEMKIIYERELKK
jgi:DNA-binding transcriptional regulator YdaS (Cro superfamily)